MDVQKILGGTKTKSSRGREKEMPHFIFIFLETVKKIEGAPKISAGAPNGKNGNFTLLLITRKNMLLVLPYVLWGKITPLCRVLLIK